MSSKKISAGSALKATAPFLAVRTLVYCVITGIMLVVAIIGIVVIAATESSVLAWIMIFLFAGAVGFAKWVERYVLYLIKAGHIFAITEYIKTGEAPKTDKGYKSILAFGTEKVKNNFGATNVAFVADTLISRAVRQIMRFLNKIGNLLSFIPGSENVLKIIESILSIALNYIDEAVLSYIFFHNEETNVWKKACDGIVYYGQSWKSMIKSAAKVSISILAVRIVVFVTGLFAGLSLGNDKGAILGLIIAYVIVYAMDKILVDPYATVVMIADYYKAIEGQPLQADLYGKFEKASGKFKELVGKAGQPVVNAQTIS